MAGKPGRIFGKEPDTRFQEFDPINNTPVYTIPTSSGKIQPNQFLKSGGGILNGPFGSVEDLLDIASAVLDLSLNAAGEEVKIRRVVHVNPETGTTDTLTVIQTQGKEIPYQELIIVGIAGDTLTISHDGSTSGTQRAILCPGNTDFTLTGDEAIYLIYDSSLSKWILLSGGSTASGATFPLSYSIDDQGNKGGVTVTHDLSASTAHMLKFTATGADTIAFSNIPSSGTGIDWYVEITQDSTGGRVITWPSAVDPEPSLSTTADVTGLVALHTDDGGTIIRAVVLLNGGSSTVGANKTLSNLDATTTINSSLVPDTAGTLDLGSDLKYWDQMKTEEIKFLGSKPDPPSSSATSISVDATGDLQFGLVDDTDFYKFYFDGTLGVTIQETGGLGQVNSANFKATNNIIMIDSSGDPAGNGIFKMNGNDVKVYSGGAVRNFSNIGGSGGAATTTLDNLGTTSINAALVPDTAGTLDLGSDAGYWDQVKCQEIKFLGSKSAPAGGVTQITMSSGNDMQFGVNAATDVYKYYFNGNSRVTFQETGSEGLVTTDQLKANKQFILLDSSSDPAINGIFMNNGGDIQVYSGGSVRNFSNIGGGGETAIWTVNHDANGNTLILDADADSSIASTSDDNIELTTGGSVRISISNTSLLVADQLTVSGVTQLDGNVSLGDTNSDTITANGDFISDLNPRDSGGSGQYDIGGSTAVEHWRHGYFDGTLTCDALAADNGTKITIKHDMDFTSGKFADMGNTQSGTGAAGAGDAIPATPDGYFSVKVLGIEHVVPYYAKS